jgi:hypothetical protein
MSAGASSSCGDEISEYVSEECRMAPDYGGEGDN